MKHKSINWLLISFVGLLILGVVSYLWATKLISSAEAFRSPLASNPPKPGVPLGKPLTRRVVIVLIDALRYDTSMNSTVMPFLSKLRIEGASAKMHSQRPSFSAPGWTTILTGAWPDINDSQLFNPPDDFSARPITQDNIFAAADRSGLRSAVSGYIWFNNMLTTSGIDSGYYTPGEDQIADRSVVDAALPWLQSDYQLILIHIDQVDFAGHHQGGPLNPSWNAAATRSDSLIQEIVSSLDLTKDTVLLVSDHGQIDRGGHGGPEPITLLEPFVIAGAGIIPGQYHDVNMVDVAPTLAALLGTNIPATNEGRVLTQMIMLPEGSNSTIQEELSLQQVRLLNSYTSAIGSTAGVGSGDMVTATQNALIQARNGRLAAERVWRNVIAVMVALVPAYYLFTRKDNKLLWFLAGGLIYVLLFNFRYAILDSRTYSLASVESASWLITYTGSTTLLASLVAWLIPMIGLRGFTNGVRRAVVLSMGAVWFTIYLVGLPVLLSFALNGAIVSWTLPEFYTLYVGLLSVIQWIFIALAGLLFTGLVVLFSFLVTNINGKRLASE
jgi:hypothetical protein